MVKRLLLLLCCACLTCATWALTIVPATPDAMIFAGTAMVPLQPMAELSGATLEITAATATVQRGEDRLVYDLRAGAVTRNGAPLAQPRPPLDRNGIWYVPLRPLVEGLGGTLSLDKDMGVLIAHFIDPDTSLTLPMRRQTVPLEFFDNDLELWVINIDGTGRRRLTYNEDDDDLPVFASDRTIVSVDSAGALIVRAFDDPNGRRILPQHLCSEPVLFSFVKDGMAFIFTETFNAILDIGSEKVSGARVIGYVMPMEVSPDRRWFAYNYCASEKARHQSVRVVTFTGKTVRTIDDGESPFFSPDGRTLYFFRQEVGSMFVMSLWQASISQDGIIGKPKQVPLPSWGISTCTLTPDGRAFIFSGEYNGPGIYCTDADGSNLAYLLEGNYTHPEVSPDGTKICCWLQDKLCIMDADGANLRELTSADTGLQGAIFTPDSRQLLFFDYPR